MLCNKCGTEKAPEDFSFKDSGKSVKKKICKICHSAYRKQHYLQNKAKYIAKAVIWNNKQKDILMQYLFETLRRSQCVDCGEKDIVVLDFDHISDKKLGIAEMYRNRYSLQAIKDEIKKCVIRCANCHRRKTAKESGFWKFRRLKI